MKICLYEDLSGHKLIVKAWLDGQFFSAIIGDSRQCNITLATAGNHQRQKYLCETYVIGVIKNSIIKVFTYEDMQSPATICNLFKILNKLPSIAH